MYQHLDLVGKRFLTGELTITGLVTIIHDDIIVVSPINCAARPAMMQHLFFNRIAFSFVFAIVFLPEVLCVTCQNARDRIGTMVFAGAKYFSDVCGPEFRYFRCLKSGGGVLILSR